jgi:hypothetical protein
MVRSVLAFIGGMTLLVAGIIASWSILSKTSAVYRLEASHPSPDNLASLEVALAMSGGAAGSCSRDLLVLPHNVPFDADANQVQYRVAWLGCNGKVQVVWETGSRLHVRVIGEGLSAYDLHGKDVSGRIQIDYSFGA